MGKIDDADVREGFRTRRLTTEDLDQYNALLRYAFQVTEMDLKKAGWKDDEFIQSKFPILERADVLGCYDDEELTKNLRLKFKMWYWHHIGIHIQDARYALSKFYWKRKFKINYFVHKYFKRNRNKEE